MKIPLWILPGRLEESVKTCTRLGMVDGVTTNLSLIRQIGPPILREDSSAEYLRVVRASGFRGPSRGDGTMIAEGGSCEIARHRGQVVGDWTGCRLQWL